MKTPSDFCCSFRRSVRTAVLTIALAALVLAPGAALADPEVWLAWWEDTTARDAMVSLLLSSGYGVTGYAYPHSLAYLAGQDLSRYDGIIIMPDSGMGTSWYGGQAAVDNILASKIYVAAMGEGERRSSTWPVSLSVTAGRSSQREIP